MPERQAREFTEHVDLRISLQRGVVSNFLASAVDWFGMLRAIGGLKGMKLNLGPPSDYLEERASLCLAVPRCAVYCLPP